MPISSSCDPQVVAELTKGLCNTASCRHDCPSRSLPFLFLSARVQQLHIVTDLRHLLMARPHQELRAVLKPQHTLHQCVACQESGGRRPKASQEEAPCVQSTTFQRTFSFSKSHQQTCEGCAEMSGSRVQASSGSHGCSEPLQTHVQCRVAERWTDASGLSVFFLVKRVEVLPSFSVKRFFLPDVFLVRRSRCFISVTICHQHQSDDFCSRRVDLMRDTCVGSLNSSCLVESVDQIRSNGLETKNTLASVRSDRAHLTYGSKYT